MASSKKTKRKAKRVRIGKIKYPYEARFDINKDGIPDRIIIYRKKKGKQKIANVDLSSEYLYKIQKKKHSKKSSTKKRAKRVKLPLRVQEDIDKDGIKDTITIYKRRKGSGQIANVKLSSLSKSKKSKKSKKGGKKKTAKKQNNILKKIKKAVKKLTDLKKTEILEPEVDKEEMEIYAKIKHEEKRKRRKEAYKWDDWTKKKEEWYASEDEIADAMFTYSEKLDKEDVWNKIRSSELFYEYF